MRGEFYQQLTNDLETARAEGLFKEERIITSAQQADITVADGSHVINFCANNYLGLANHPDLIAAAKAGMDSHGFGMASVRFICGTQDSHKELEQKLAAFLGMEDAILYSSCFAALTAAFLSSFFTSALCPLVTAATAPAPTASAASPSPILFFFAIMITTFL